MVTKVIIGKIRLALYKLCDLKYNSIVQTTLCLSRLLFIHKSLSITADNLKARISLLFMIPCIL